jgi:hypothetical protein
LRFTPFHRFNDSIPVNTFLRTQAHLHAGRRTQAHLNPIPRQSAAGSQVIPWSSGTRLSVFIEQSPIPDPPQIPVVFPLFVFDVGNPSSVPIREISGHSVRLPIRVNSCAFVVATCLPQTFF